MSNAADNYEAGVPIWVKDSNGVAREYVPAHVYHRVVERLQVRLRETVAFAERFVNDYGRPRE